jgi:tryptophan halogenase
MKNLVIVGGGTAGWLTAIYAKRTFPDHIITLVESRDIGILGAGEGSTAIFVDFLDYLEISVQDLIKEAKATIKSGIKFTGWSSDNDKYYHGFKIRSNSLAIDSLNSLDSSFKYPAVSLSNLISFYNNERVEDYDFVANVSEQNKVLVNYNESVPPNPNTLLSFNKYANYSLHFDARILAEYLSNFGISKGINYVEGKVSDLHSLDGENISSISLENGISIDTDFIFDCSGFAKLIIGKHFKSQWISFKDKLPMKKAIPFFIDIDKDNIPPYTESIAMNYGWMWKIPLQHRYGCGYVFDSDYISEEEAIQEIEEFLGFEPNYPKKDKGSFNFEPGCFSTVLNKNVIAVGLASGFVEPLEATSIMQTIVLLKRLFTDPSLMFEPNQDMVDRFNSEYVSDCEEVADFIQMHYLTNKTNTDFWKNFKEKNLVSQSLEKKILILNNSLLLQEDSGTLFPSDSYYLVAKGLGLLSQDNMVKQYNYLNLSDLEDTRKNQKLTQKKFMNSFLSHSFFLKELGGLSD